MCNLYQNNKRPKKKSLSYSFYLRQHLNANRISALFHCTCMWKWASECMLAELCGYIYVVVLCALTFWLSEQNDFHSIEWKSFSFGDQRVKTCAGLWFWAIQKVLPKPQTAHKIMWTVEWRRFFSTSGICFGWLTDMLRRVWWNCLRLDG